jgi:hypothetical protein
MTTATKTYEDGKYIGTFDWGNSPDVEVELSKNRHGWFCDSINGIEWQYPTPTNPWSGWGVQCAKDTPLKALRGFLAQWDANCEDEHGVCTRASRLKITRTAGE